MSRRHEHEIDAPGELGEFDDEQPTTLDPLPRSGDDTAHLLATTGMAPEPSPSSTVNERTAPLPLWDGVFEADTVLKRPSPSAAPIAAPSDPFAALPPTRVRRPAQGGGAGWIVALTALGIALLLGSFLLTLLVLR